LAQAISRTSSAAADIITSACGASPQIILGQGLERDSGSGIRIGVVSLEVGGNSIHFASGLVNRHARLLVSRLLLLRACFCCAYTTDHSGAPAGRGNRCWR
jgi:hypothetical protein